MSVNLMASKKSDVVDTTDVVAENKTHLVRLVNV